jgi:LAS superfamily LD-carboxypeptidase LdcB
VTLSLQERELLGLDGGHLCCVGTHYLREPVHRAFSKLAQEAQKAGFRLEIASAHRSFERQLRIWNGKLCGERPVLDDHDRPVDLASLDPLSRIHSVLRFSALPGTSRHHWGTDIDVFDAAAVAPDYKLQLSAREVEAGGVFAPLHEWLDGQITAGRSFGFYRPYDRDRGGVAPERWHLSYAPLATACGRQLRAGSLREAWHEVSRTATFLSLAQVDELLDELLERYVERAAAPPSTALDYRPGAK